MALLKNSDLDILIDVLKMEKERCRCYICPFEALSQGEFQHHLKHKHKNIRKKTGPKATTTIARTPRFQAVDTEKTDVTDSFLLGSTSQQQQPLKIPCSNIDSPDHLGLPSEQQQLNVPCSNADLPDPLGLTMQQQDEDGPMVVLIKEEFYDCVLSDDEDFALDNDSISSGEFARDDRPGVNDDVDNEEAEDDDDSALLKLLHEQELRNFAFIKIKGFCCKSCNSSFKTTDIEQLKEHQLNCSLQEDQNEDVGEFDIVTSQSEIVEKEMKCQCDICNRRFTSINFLRRHKQCYHDESSFQCEICKETIVSKYNFNLHQHRVHGRFICPICSKILPSQASLPFHNRQFHEYVYRNKNQVKEKVRCDICQKEFKSKSFFDRHMSSSHDQESYECKVCSKTFISKKLFNFHRVHHSENKAMCEICSEIFNSVFRLKLHMKSVHDTSKNSYCKKCDKAFTYREYRNHCDSVHRKKEIHTCDQCGKTFDRKNLIKRHLKHVHNKVKSHICNLCGKGFPQLQNLQKHMSGFHEKLKPFQCKLCGNYFSQTSSLSLHMKNMHKIHWTQKMDKDLVQESEK